MTATSAADYPTLGFDPSPGDVTEVARISLTLERVATAMAEIRSVLHGADDGEWRGEAAVSFRSLLDDDLRPKIDQAEKAFRGASGAIGGWESSLTGFQSRARGYERLAVLAQERADRARQALAALPDAPGPLDLPVDDAERQQRADDAQSRSTQQGNLTDALADVEHYRELARTMRDEEYAEAGRRAASLLEHSIDIAPTEPGWLDQALGSIGDLVDSLKDLVADLTDQLVDFLHSIAPLLQLLGDIAGFLAGVVGFLAIFFPALAVVALALAVIALITHYAARVGETGSVTKPLSEGQFWMDVASVALGVGGLAVGAKMANLATTVRGAGATPPSFFRLVQGGTYTTTEMHFLLGSWKITQASSVLDTISMTGSWQGIVDGLTGRTPLGKRPVVVA